MSRFRNAHVRRGAAALILLGALSCGCSAANPPAGAPPDATSANKKLVTDFFTQAFVHGEVAPAADRYIGDVYLQHNPEVPDGKQAFVTAIGGYIANTPGLRVTIKRVIAEGDLVVVHSLYQAENQPDAAVADIFRVDGGKIVEHWDVQQSVPANTASGRPMA